MRLPAIPLPPRSPESAPTETASMKSAPKQGESGEPETFIIETVIRLEDRVAAAMFIYQDLFRAARQRLLAFLLVVLALLLAMAGHTAWQATAGQGFIAFLSRLGGDLLGLGGLPIALISIPTLIGYLLQPAIVRRRLRRWYRDEQRDQPFPLVVQFWPGGLTSSANIHVSVIACRRVTGVVWTGSHVMIGLRDLEDVIALPERDLTPEDRAHLRQWSAFCHAAGPGAVLDPPAHALQNPPAGDPLMSMGYQPTAADRAAGLAWQMERPAIRRRRRNGFALTFILTALLPPALMVLLWLLDPERVPARYAAPLLAEMFATDFWQWILALWAVIGLLLLIHPWLRRRQAETLGARLHARQTNPAGQNAVSFSVYPDVLVWRQDGLYNQVGWKGFDGLERRGDDVFLIYRGGDPVLIPARAFPPGQLAAFGREVARRTGMSGARDGAAEAGA